MSRIVLNSGTKSGLSHHLHIKVGSLRNSLRLQKLVIALKISHLLFQLFQNILRSRHHLFFRHNIVGRREDCHMAKLCFHLAGQCINFHNPIHFVTEKFDPVCLTAGISRKYFQNISTHTERTSFEIHLVSRILDIDQFVNYLIAVLDHTRSQRNYHLLIINRASKSVDAGHRRNNDHIISLRKCCRRRVAQLIDLIVDRRVFFNISIR